MEGRTNFLGWKSQKTIMSNHDHKRQTKYIKPYCTWVGDRRKALALYPTIYGHISLLLPAAVCIPAQMINVQQKCCIIQNCIIQNNKHTILYTSIPLSKLQLLFMIVLDNQNLNTISRIPSNLNKSAILKPIKHIVQFQIEEKDKIITKSAA